MTFHYAFDLDDTLVDTFDLEVYRGTNEGRAYLPQNIAALPTKSFHPDLLKLVKSLSKKSFVSIITNAPEDYARAVLKKHHFPDNLYVQGSANKPSIQETFQARHHSGADKSKTILIGDHPKDILTAHDLNIVSVGVTWGRQATEQQLERAEPQHIVHDIGALEQTIIAFEKGQLKYSQRTEPDKYLRLPKAEDNTPVPEIDIFWLDKYHPYRSEGFNHHSAMILLFKKGKNFTSEEITAGARDDYFSYDKIKPGRKIILNYGYFQDQLTSLIQEKKLLGNTLVLPAPNSLLEYCYRGDFTVDFLKNLCAGLENHVVAPRSLIPRIFPKEESHNSGVHSLKEHYDTMGLRNDITSEQLNEYDNVLIFDDITTSGAQLQSIGKILTYFGFKGKLYGVALGKTG